MLAWYLLVAAQDDFLKCFLEVVIECDVNHRVDHGVGVGKHIEPELVVFFKTLRELKHKKKLYFTYNKQVSCLAKQLTNQSKL